jgi:hypothetical protein
MVVDCRRVEQRIGARSACRHWTIAGAPSTASAPCCSLFGLL